MQVHRTSEILCVDLDGTLVATDLLAESLLLLLRSSPWHIFVLPWWLIQGRATLKQEIARRVTIDFERLPYRKALVSFLEEERRRGRRLVLITAADRRLAQGVADHLRLFAEVHGSDGVTNLKGATKASRLVDRYGEGAFTYVGDSSTDLAVWLAARHAILAGASESLRRKVARSAKIERTFDDNRVNMRTSALIRVIRPHQWVKNVLVFVPLITAHRLMDMHAWFNAGKAFAAMCLAAGAIYIANDLLDLAADRVHPTKRSRPLASGELAIGVGIVCVPILLIAAALLALTLPTAFLAWIGVYGTAAVLYSLWFKQFAIVDVIVLAALYAVRLLAGAAAIAVPMSAWLLAFSLFFFFSLALAKRHVELYATRQANAPPEVRGYLQSDLDTVAMFGIASGYLSVLVMALYTDGRDTALLYSHPTWLWGFAPLLLFWVSRLWLLAARGHLHEDPVMFAVRDWASYAVLLGLGVCMYLAI